MKAWLDFVADEGWIDSLEGVLETLFESSPILVTKLTPQLASHLSQSSIPPPSSYSSLIDLSLSILSSWKPQDRAAFIAGHPSIGEVSNLSALSASEQASKATPPEILLQLNYLNMIYELVYPGLRYITFVNGRSRAEIVPEMQDAVGFGRDAVTRHERESPEWLQELGRAIYDIGLIAKSRLRNMGIEQAPNSVTITQPPTSTVKRGAFIVVEGLDRSGKTTQTATLCDRFSKAGVPTKLMKFPDRTTETGAMIDSYLRSQTELDDRAIHLLFSANRWEASETILSHLTAGTTVICDRYAFSGIAFSAAKALDTSHTLNPPSSFNSKSTLTYEWCRSPDMYLPSPDLILFLDISPSKALERGGFGEERYEREDVQRRVRQVFSRIEQDFKEGEWVLIDASQTMDEVSQSMWMAIDERGLTGTVTREIGRLWT